MIYIHDRHNYLLGLDINPRYVTVSKVCYPERSTIADHNPRLECKGTIRILNIAQGYMLHNLIDSRIDTHKFTLTNTGCGDACPDLIINNGYICGHRTVSIKGWVTDFDLSDDSIGCRINS